MLASGSVLKNLKIISENSHIGVACPTITEKKTFSFCEETFSRNFSIIFLVLNKSGHYFSKQYIY